MVSVIVPAYNAERWLDAAVASVTAQTVRDWELVLVDDGSTDGTPALCDRLAAGDRRIRILHTTNGGLSAARNNGLDVACGEWVTFLDADDLLHPRFLETMLSAARRTGADIVNCAMLEFHGETVPFAEIKEPPHIGSYTPVQALRFGMYQRHGIHTSAWGKIYRWGLWETERFTPGTWYEDLDAFYRVWTRCRKFAQLDVALYAYRQHPGSFLHNYTPRRQDVLDVTARMEEWTATNMPELLSAARDRRMSAGFNIFLLSERAVRSGQCTRREVRGLQRRCFDIIRQRRSGSLWGRHTRPKNRLGAFLSYFGPTFLRILC